MRTTALQKRISAELGSTWDALLSFPKYVDLDTVNQCNARCVMCGVGFKGRRKAFMSDALFAKLADELGRHADEVVRVGLAVNCEPLLDPSLERRIAILKAAGIGQTYVSTNAALLTPARARALLGVGLDTTYVSIDSLNPKVFEGIRRGLKFATVYRHAREFIRLKNELRPQGIVRISMVLQDANRDEADAFVEHWAALLGPRDQVNVSRAYDWNRARGFDRLADADLQRRPCPVLWSSLVVRVDGKVPMCCIDTGATHLLGDASSQTLEEIWHGEPLARLRKLHLAGRRGELSLCAPCTVWRKDRQVMRRSGGNHGS